MKIIIIEKSIVIRERLIAWISTIPEINVIGQAASLEKSVMLINQLKPDAIITDINMSDEGEIALLKHIKSKSFSPFILVLAKNSSPLFRKRYLNIGVDHILDKLTEFDKVNVVLKHIIQNQFISQTSKTREVH